VFDRLADAEGVKTRAFLACSSNGFSRRIASLEEATSPRPPLGETSITPAAETSSRVTHRFASPVSRSTTS
jgi:hypothetical protein